jgi:N4-(beta-N-acetylglucosaminyl)-L-asparaginase
MTSVRGHLLTSGLLLLLSVIDTNSFIAEENVTPVVIATWNFVNATEAAWNEVGVNSGTAVDAVVVGCSVCEEEQCDGSVGYGGSPDENGESTLDAMIMDGVTMKVGSVANLRSVKNAIGVAHAVMKYTEHTLLVGSLATDFAVSMGFEKTNLSTENSIRIYENWKNANCQPNFRQDVTPDPHTNCGPYTPITSTSKSFNLKTDVNRFKSQQYQKLKKRSLVDKEGSANYQHDTIGMLVIDGSGSIAGGTSTNGATHKIPGRVGDSPIIGSGAYVENDVGGAAATGDGDVMMRFVPSYHAVEQMRNGKTPSEAATSAILRISKYYPSFSGAVIAMNMTGHYGAACHGLSSFPFTVMSSSFTDVQIFHVNCV